MPVVWLWMFIAGLGVGPTFSVPTIVIQNAVPFKQLGVATSNLTFFRQIGGTIALAFVGTIFATSFQDNLIPQMTAAGVPQQVINGFTQASSSGSFDFNSLTGVGDLARRSWRPSRPSSRRRSSRSSAPWSKGIHGAFSLATAQTFWLGVFGSVVAFARRARDQGDPAPDVERAAGPDPDDRPDRPARPAARRPSPSRSRPAPPSATDLRSSSRSTAPVDPTGAVVRPAGYDAMTMDPRPATLPAAPPGARHGRTPRSRPCSTSPTCRPARCAG